MDLVRANANPVPLDPALRLDPNEQRNPQQLLRSAAKPIAPRSCDDEPIHTPGAIQTTGVLVATDPTRDYKPVTVSENCAALFGDTLTPDAILSMSTIATVVCGVTSSIRNSAIRAVEPDSMQANEVDELSRKAGSTQASFKNERAQHSRTNHLRLWGAQAQFRRNLNRLLRIGKAQRDLTCIFVVAVRAPRSSVSALQFEESDELSNSGTSDEDLDGEALVFGVHQRAMTQRSGSRLFYCTANRTETNGGLVILEFEPYVPLSEESSNKFFFSEHNLVEMLQKSSDASELYRIATEQVLLYTGYDRVMLYVFDRDGHGHVVEEALRTKEQDSYKGILKCQMSVTLLYRNAFSCFGHSEAGSSTLYP